MRKNLDSWCDENKALSSVSSQLYQESRSVSSSALSAWNNCQDAAKKQVIIKLKNQAEVNEFLHFGIDSTADGDIYLTSVLQKGYKCRVSAKQQDSSLKELSQNITKSNQYENVVLDRQIPIRNDNIHVNCQRTNPSTKTHEGVGTMQYESGSVVINTTGPSFSIDIPKVVEDYFYTPSGAIMAFTSSCPRGWREANELEGKFPIGAGSAGGSGRNIPLKSTGGSYKYRLGVAHNEANCCNGDRTIWGVAIDWHGEGALKKHNSSGNEPGGSPNYTYSGWKEHLPPYYAVRYCVKN